MFGAWIIGGKVNAARGQLQVTRNEQRLAVEFGQAFLLRKEVHQFANFCRMLGVFHGDQSRTTRHACAGSGTTGSGYGPPIKRIADLVGKLRDLPGARHIHHHLSVGEIFVRAKVGRTRDRAPQLF